GVCCGARPHSQEESEFLAAVVAGRGLGTTYADLEHASTVLLAGFEPEEEAPTVFLRLRKAVRKHGTRVYAIAAYASRGVDKLSGTLLTTVPGGEAQALTTPDLPLDANSVILVGERLAAGPRARAPAARAAPPT